MPVWHVRLQDDNVFLTLFQPDETRSIAVQADLEYDYRGFEFTCEHLPRNSAPRTALTAPSVADASTYVSMAITKDVKVETDHPKKADFGQTVEDDLQGPVQVLGFEENQFKAFTGTSKSIFFFLLDAAKAFNEEIRDSQRISRECKLLMCLIKLKLNLSFVVLASMFCISENSAGRHFGSVLHALKVVAKNGVSWLDRETIQARMPASFRSLYPRTRCIIDCSEIRCQRPGTVRQRTLYYSNYKGGFTVKFLVGCAPSGEITFISPGFGGRTTDCEITTQSGFLDLIEQGDVILADKGFPQIERDLNTAGGLLVMPPFATTGRQFTEVENKAGYQCASVRIHIERCIERLKRFDILSGRPLKMTMMKHIDDILLVTAFLVNTYPDLIKQD